MATTNFTRVIYVFDKLTETLVQDVDLDISVEKLRRIVIPYDDDNDDMIMAYDIDQSIANQLKAYTDLSFDFDRYIYNLGAYSS